MPLAAKKGRKELEKRRKTSRTYLETETARHNFPSLIPHHGRNESRLGGERRTKEESELTPRRKWKNHPGPSPWIFKTKTLAKVKSNIIINDPEF